MDIRKRKLHTQDKFRTESGTFLDSPHHTDGASDLDEEHIHHNTIASTKVPTKFMSLRLILALAIYWWIAIHVVERVRVRTVIDKCQWNLWEPWTDMKGYQIEATPHRVAFIADPQLVDTHTYPNLSRVVNYLLQKLSDNYLSVSYRYVQEILGPDTTIFIGDLFDGGRDWADPAWLEEYHRFNRIFPESPNRKSYRGLPGNHDIGFQNISPAKAKRFADHFGEPNAAYVLGNHTFVQLDTISLLHEDPEVHTKASHFLEDFKALFDRNLPRIVLSHVPLYRDPQLETCAPGRESPKPFPLMRGVQYQTVIDYKWTEDILHNISPVLVFSGDDHDYCDITHVNYTDNSKYLAREISCKTISMTNGIRRPAVQLLSLYNPQEKEFHGSSGSQEKTYETTMCYLPSPYFGAKVHFASLMVSFMILR